MRIIHAIARLNVGGAALSVLELAAEQQRRGHEVLVVAGTVPPGEESLEHLTEELEVPYRHLPTLQRELSPIADTRTVAAFRSLLRAQRVDVLHTHTSKAGATGRVAALLAGRGRPRAVVHQFHGHVLAEYFDPARERLYRLVERTLARSSGALVAVSAEVRDDLVRLGIAPPEKIHVIAYGFDLDRRLATPPGARSATRERLGAGEDTFVIGWAGRLTQIKRPLDLVRVAAAVDGAMLLLAGDGELRADVEQLATELGTADRVVLLGYVDGVAELYAAFDSFLLTSANEGTPVVAIEALAAGVPVVATDAGGTRTVVDDGETGFLAPVGDVTSLTAAVERLRDDPALREAFGSEGRRRMRERFSTARMADETDALYRELLER